MSQIQNHVACGSSCPIGNYCNACNDPSCDCSSCLYQIQHGNPSFHYSCHKITYHYTLRFFNRFASEITYLLCKFDYSTCKELNVVSLGCGPGSEVYGLIKALRLKKASTILNYEGHDLNPYWEKVQTLSKHCLSKSPHNIKFYTTNLFADYHGFNSNKISILIFNYLLSDAALFMSNMQKNQFSEEIVDFVIRNNVRNILFNDINYYGDARLLNSGTQIMKLIISKLRQTIGQLKTAYYCFPGDRYRGGENWEFYSNNGLVLASLQGNNYMTNVNYCNSKQIFVHIQ